MNHQRGHNSGMGRGPAGPPLEKGKMMTDVTKPVDEQVKDLLTTWNKPYTDDGLHRLVGQPVPEGDGRATAAVVDPTLNHDRNPGRDDLDAERMFADDGGDATGDGDADEDDEDEGDSYEDMTVKELKAEIDSRNEDRDEDDHLTKTGKHADLVARLEADDEAQAAGDDEEDDGEE